MKKFAGFLLGVIALGIFLGSAHAAEKFAYVDLSRIFSEYNKTKVYDEALSDKESTYTESREKKVNEIKKLQDKMNLLNDKQKESKKPGLQARIEGLQEFDRERQTDLRKEQDEKMKEIFKDIEDAVKQYSKKQGLSLVFNNRVLIYETKTLDITDEVVKILNKRYKR